MFVDYKRPNSRQVGRFVFHGGLTKVDSKTFYDSLKKDNVKKSFDDLVEHGIFEVIGDKVKLTKAMIEKTFDMKLLTEYQSEKNLSAVLKGAVKKQIEALTLPEAV